MFLARSPIRSRSLDTRSAPTISLRSTAIGCRRAIVSTARSSISACSASMLGSLATVRWARSASRRASASTASAICFSASPPISATIRVSSWRSTSKAFAVCSGITIYFVLAGANRDLAEAAGDVVLRASIARRGEHLARVVELDQLAEIHEGGEIGDARRLLHVVGDDHDRVVLFELVDQLLDLGGRDRIEPRARLVEQDHLGPHRHRARDAQALLLSAGEAQPVGGELALDLFPEGGPAQRGLHPLVELRLRQLLVQPGAEGYVLVDRHRERRRLLEHHADAGAQEIEILFGRENVLAVELDLALRPLVGVEIVHPVENPQQRRFSAARRPDEGGHLVLVERDVDAFERLAGPVIEVEVPDRHLLRQADRADRRVGDGGDCDRGGSDIHGDFLKEARARATIESASTVKVMISATIPASFCQSL